jgi:hypothetical protein
VVGRRGIAVRAVIALVQVLNFALAALMWLIVGRAAIALLTGGKPNVVQRALDRAALPLFALTRRALPFVGERWAPPATLLIVVALRLSLILVALPATGR